MTISSRLFVVLLLALCCAKPGVPAGDRAERVIVGERFAVGHGRSVEVRGEDFHLTFSAVKGDSRCPKSVVCVWAGDAAILLQVKKGQETRDVELHTSQHPQAAEAFGYRIELVELRPYPEQPSGVKASEYEAHLMLSSVSSK